MVDELLAMVQLLDPQLSLKYNKFYIGLARNGQPDNIVIFRPKKAWLALEPRLERSQEVEARIEAAGLDVQDYDPRWGRYRIRLAKGDIKKHEALIQDFLSLANSQSNT